MGLIVPGLAATVLALVSSAAVVTGGAADAGDGLSIVVPAGAHLTHKQFTPCSDPVERFSVIDGRAILTIQERQDASQERSPRRAGPFHVSGPARVMECCAIDGRRGWSIAFRDHGRAFYAYLYPTGKSAAPLLRILDTLRVAPSS
jgi:hypothetical protein